MARISKADAKRLGLLPGKRQKGKTQREFFLGEVLERGCGYVKIRLPWPPSVNNYWIHLPSGRAVLGSDGKRFRKAVEDTLVKHNFIGEFDGYLRVEIEAHPPDNLRRDLDNICKAILDSVQHAGVYQDDYRVYDLHLMRFAAESEGHVIVSISNVG